MRSEVALCTYRCASEHIAVYDAHLVALVVTVVEQCLQFFAHCHIDILGSLHLTAHEGNSAAQVHLACCHQPSNEQHHCRLNGPHRLTLVHGIDMVHLYSHVSCGARSVKYRHLHVLRVCQCRGSLFRAYSEMRLCDAREGSQSSLPLLLLSRQLKLEVCRKRFVPQSRHKYCLWLFRRHCRHGVRQLVDVAKDACLEQIVYNFVAT